VVKFLFDDELLDGAGVASQGLGQCGMT